MINLIKILCILIIWSIIILYIKKKELFLNTNVFSNNKIYVPWGESLQGCINNCIVSMIDENKGDKDNINKEYCTETCTNAKNCSKEECKWLDDSIPSITSNDNLITNLPKDEYYKIQIIPYDNYVVIYWIFFNDTTNVDKFIIQLINIDISGSGIKLYEKSPASSFYSSLYSFLGVSEVYGIYIKNLKTDSEYNISIYPILKGQTSTSKSPNIDNNNDKNFMSQIYSFSTNSTTISNLPIYKFSDI